jgi:FkbM family methyltransferase
VRSVGLGIRATASVMRHLPVHVRRVRMLRDKVYRSLGAAGWAENDEIDAGWPAERQCIKGRISGMTMELDLTDWCQRLSYFTGRFYQEELEELLSRTLRPGDHFIDIGANIGLVTLHAASLVGTRGKIWSFEPNPEAYDRLVRHLDLNDVSKNRAFNLGLGSEQAKLTLKLFGRHSGKASLVPHDEPAIRSVAVDIVRGDKVISELDPDEPTVIKIDVEGFEVAALKGLGAILDGNVAVIVEVSPAWLGQAGSSPEELFDLMQSHGLNAYQFATLQGRTSQRLTLDRLPGPLDLEQYDCLFIRPGSVFSRRLGQFIRSQ